MAAEAPEPRKAQPPSEPAAAVQPPSGTNDLAPHASAGPALAASVAAAPAAVPIRAIWERIKHHKVVQWTLAYLALAYTLLHTAEMLGNSLGWSHGLLRLFTLLLVLGVPVVIVVSWYYGASGQRGVSGTELMIIAILLAMGGTFLWRDSKMEHAPQSAASLAGWQVTSVCGKSLPLKRSGSSNARDNA
jgi:hypothetical protein